MTEKRPDELTHCYGRKPMLIEHRGMAEHVRKDGTILRYSVAVLIPKPDNRKE